MRRKIVSIILLCSCISQIVSAATSGVLGVTETRNQASKELDAMSAQEIVTLMNTEDFNVPQAITPCIAVIANAANCIAQALQKKGRLVYIGAGTSGRLGVLDASECPPTFSASPEQVVGIIAGGDKALRTPIEGAEDSLTLSTADLKNIDLNSSDVVCGISASGSAAYVTSGLEYAQSCGCTTIMITCNPAIDKHNVDFFIAPCVGSEIVTGSTRLKAGTATKMVLNMLTTTAFILLGKVFKNLMVDVKPSNKKLFARQRRILKMLFEDLDDQSAAQLLDHSGNNVKVAIVMKSCTLSQEVAADLLTRNEWNVRKAIQAH